MIYFSTNDKLALVHEYGKTLWWGRLRGAAATKILPSIYQPSYDCHAVARALNYVGTNSPIDRFTGDLIRFWTAVTQHFPQQLEHTGYTNTRLGLNPFRDLTIEWTF